MTGREKQEQVPDRRQSDERRRADTWKQQARGEDRLDEDKLDEVLRDCPL